MLRSVWRFSHGVWWCGLLLVSGLVVGLAWHQAESGIIPECAAGVDFAVSGEILGADVNPQVNGCWMFEWWAKTPERTHTLYLPSHATGW